MMNEIVALLEEELAELTHKDSISGAEQREMESYIFELEKLVSKLEIKLYKKTNK